MVSPVARLVINTVLPVNMDEGDTFTIETGHGQQIDVERKTLMIRSVESEFAEW